MAMNKDQRLKTPVELEADKFVKKIKEKYGADIYVAISNDSDKMNLNTLYQALLNVLNENDPDLIIYTSFKKITRIKPWMLYQHAFCYVAYKHLCYSKTDIGKIYSFQL